MLAGDLPFDESTMVDDNHGNGPASERVDETNQVDEGDRVGTAPATR